MLEQRTNQQAAATANAHDQVPQPAAGGGPRVLAYYMKTHPGAPDRALVLQLLADFPGDRNAMLAMLQKQVGNAYVQDLVAASTAPAAKAAAVAAPPTTSTAPTATAPAPGVHIALTGPNGPSAVAAGSF